LKLAVPLIELCGVIEWQESVTEMPGHADFYMGILQYLNNKIAVIDTARMVMPANKLEQLVGDDPRSRVKHIVLIDDYRWGLACDKIGEVITLKPNEVRWRTSKTTRGWLAGTVIEHMCALLNSEGFASLLESGGDFNK
ncbi:MAG: chemotaxis protein CheW, partial [Gammaproteobacteria bacterium]|nr:chemotaxis protein CheW [Gammaproteobacteria bacterium]